eukprot:g2736.t1
MPETPILDEKKRPRAADPEQDAADKAAKVPKLSAPDALAAASSTNPPTSKTTTKKKDAAASPAGTEEMDECRRTERLEESSDAEELKVEDHIDVEAGKAAPEDASMLSAVEEQEETGIAVLPDEDEDDNDPMDVDPPVSARPPAQEAKPAAAVVEKVDDLKVAGAAKIHGKAENKKPSGAAAPAASAGDEDDLLQDDAKSSSNNADDVEAEDWKWDGGVAPNWAPPASDAEPFYTLDKGKFKLPKGIYEKLYPYQRHAVAWMWCLYKDKRGGIHADEMGLGKTVMVCAFLAGLAASGLGRHFLLVVPNTLFITWTEELKKWVCESSMNSTCATTTSTATAVSSSSSSSSSAAAGAGDAAASSSSSSSSKAKSAKNRSGISSQNNSLDLSLNTSLNASSVSSAPSQFFVRYLCGDSTKKERAESIRKIARCGGALLTSYGLVKTSLDAISCVSPPVDKNTIAKKKGGKNKNAKKQAVADDDFDEEEEEEKQYALLADRKPWDAVFCDEAHQLKERSSQGAKSLRQVNARAKFLLTGTPYQNNLGEIWSLADLAAPGVLGNFQTFTQNFSDPIVAGSRRNASTYAVLKKDKLSRELKNILSSHFLRRDKQAVLKEIAAGKNIELGSGSSSSSCSSTAAGATTADAAGNTLPPKKDVILFCELSEKQKKMYSDFLNSDIVREARQAKKKGIESFKAISLLKKVCDHPLMCLPFVPYHQQMLQKWGMMAGNVETPEEKEADLDENKGYDWKSLVNQIPQKAEEAVGLSCKLQLLNALVPKLVFGRDPNNPADARNTKKHRVLIFSYSTRMLDLIQSSVLRPNGVKFLRIDGAVELGEREKKIQKFENDVAGKFHCMCLSTKVGGVGLTLVSADRVILVEPGWSPAIDQQAMDRAHRLGQKKEVVVYRIISHATIEDKMFRVQVFKQGLCKTALGKENQQRYFNTDELKTLFTKLEDESSSTLKLLDCEEDSDKVCQTLIDDVGELEEDNKFWTSAGLRGFADYSELFQGFDEEAKKAEKDEKDVVIEEVQEAVVALKTEAYKDAGDSPNRSGKKDRNSAADGLAVLEDGEKEIGEPGEPNGILPLMDESLEAEVAGERQMKDKIVEKKSGGAGASSSSMGFLGGRSGGENKKAAARSAPGDECDVKERLDLDMLGEEEEDDDEDQAFLPPESDKNSGEDLSSASKDFQGSLGNGGADGHDLMLLQNANERDEQMLSENET